MRRATLNIRGQMFVLKQKTARFTSCGNRGSARLVHTGMKIQQNLQPLLDFVKFF